VTFVYRSSLLACYRLRSRYTGTTATPGFTSGTCDKGTGAARDATGRTTTNWPRLPPGAVPRINNLPVRVGSSRFANGLRPPFPTCQAVFFDPPFADSEAASISVTTTVRHDQCCNNAVSSWTMDVTATGFTVCVREYNSFSGFHPPFTVTYMAAAGSSGPLAAAGQVSLSGVFSWGRSVVCSNIFPGGAFSGSYVTAAYATVHYPRSDVEVRVRGCRRARSPVCAACTQRGPINTGMMAFVNYVGYGYARVCVSATGGSHAPVLRFTVNYILFGQQAPVAIGVDDFRFSAASTQYSYSYYWWWYWYRYWWINQATTRCRTGNSLWSPTTAVPQVTRARPRARAAVRDRTLTAVARLPVRPPGRRWPSRSCTTTTTTSPSRPGWSASPPWGQRRAPLQPPPFLGAMANEG
jgi:hypothetical protein